MFSSFQNMCDFAIGFTLPYKTLDNIIIAVNTNTNKHHIAVNYNENGEKCKTLCGQVLNTPFDGWKPNWSKCEPVKSISEFDNMFLFWHKCERCEKRLENIRKDLTKDHINELFYDNKPVKEENMEERIKDEDMEKYGRVVDEILMDSEGDVIENQYLVTVRYSGENSFMWCETEDDLKELINKLTDKIAIKSVESFLQKVSVFKLKKVGCEVTFAVKHVRICE